MSLEYKEGLKTDTESPSIKNPQEVFISKIKQLASEIIHISKDSVDIEKWSHLLNVIYSLSNDVTYKSLIRFDKEKDNRRLNILAKEFFKAIRDLEERGIVDDIKKFPYPVRKLFVETHIACHRILDCEMSEETWKQSLWGKTFIRNGVISNFFYPFFRKLEENQETEKWDYFLMTKPNSTEIIKVLIDDIKIIDWKYVKISVREKDNEGKRINLFYKMKKVF